MAVEFLLISFLAIILQVVLCLLISHDYDCTEVKAFSFHWSE